MYNILININITINITLLITINRSNNSVYNKKKKNNCFGIYLRLQLL